MVHYLLQLHNFPSHCQKDSLLIQEELKELTGKIPLVISSFSEEGLEELMQILFDKCDQNND